MIEKIDVFLPEDLDQLGVNINNGLASADDLIRISENASAEYVLLCTKATKITLGQFCEERMLRVAADTDAAMVYSDHYSLVEEQLVKHPVIDYQLGAVRDDFDFGSLWLIKSSLLKEWVEALKEEPAGGSTSAADCKFAALYDLRLFLSRKGEIFHINELLYTEEELDTRKSGEKQFDYVNPRNREVQIEMEQAVTRHLGAIGALIDTAFYRQPDFDEQDFEYEASVIIPVFNREKTVADAVKSALDQKCNFKFNVIVVNNHSTDKTGEILETLSKEYNVQSSMLNVIVPERNDLGIGGCWNEAINSDYCGKFAVQLDSDDLYSSSHTLQKIVDAFHKQKAAMIIGSYRMCDFELNTLPPGMIDHREWTDDNGCNNALRINGLGAPRAFFTPLVRQIQFPNTSYGEDYALGLAFSRHYRIGRIYDELYLCRRWGGNSDSNLSIEKVNANNLYKDRLRTMEIHARLQLGKGKNDRLEDNALSRFFHRQLEKWDQVRQRFSDLRRVEIKELPITDPAPFTLKVQFNPARIVSTGAKIDAKTIEKRPCFLCDENRPKEQLSKPVDEQFHLLINPFPILPVHYTVPSRKHQPQAILENYGEMHKLLSQYSDLMVFYNGPKCGASAPDHMHFQAGTSGILPLQAEWARLSRNLETVLELNGDEKLSIINDYPCHAFVIKSKTAEGDSLLFNRLYKALENTSLNTPKTALDYEPMLNVVAWRKGEEYISVVFPRKKHRPDCYFAEDDSKMLISPGALDMAGLTITPRREDFERITAEQMVAILKEMTIEDEQMNQVVETLKAEDCEELKARKATLQMEKEPDVAVGIVSAERIHFVLNQSYMAKGEKVEGPQTVEFSEGAILWNGKQYSQITFHPQSAKCSFSLDDVIIGVNFHWERKETQTFLGTLKLVVEEDKICAINQLPVEHYLESVISSEMSATSSLELLKAHAVISRSWLLAQMEKRKKVAEEGNSFFSFVKKDDELIRWYDREDHTIFDVCADDHCQRYQGITKETSPHVAEAIRQTKGQILMNEDEICDARFSKCCGGVTEEFQYCWENIKKPYLIAVRDNTIDRLKNGKNEVLSEANNTSLVHSLNLSNEEAADKWIRTSPDSFCNTQDKKVLSQVLNDYDQETADFYRWKVEYTQEQVKQLLADKLKLELGDILDLVAVERGLSGRISKLKIVGTKKTFTIGKELEIRRALSNTHLYSSAFVVDKYDKDANGVPQRFEFIGAGWGHGVGLCQIGAAVMGEEGYNYDEILLHYYRGAEINKIY